MSKTTRAHAAAEPMFEIDRKARKLFKPHHETVPLKALAWFGQAGDQLQLRVLCAGVIAAGLVRGDARLAGTGARMLVSHELATLAKLAVKKRVDRARPRSAHRRKDHKPRKGDSRAKELSSFPSGHSAGAMAVACAFAAGYPEHRAPALAAGAAVSLAQIPTCAHYPSDVATGAAIGAATDGLVGLAWRALGRLWIGRTG